MANNMIRKRRKLSGIKKYSILEEWRKEGTKKGELLRREGLYSADIQRFEQISREGAIEALDKSRPGRHGKPDVPFAEHEALRQELARKETALCELATEFTILKKKVNGE
jgi:hypothetical protein